MTSVAPATEALAARVYEARERVRRAAHAIETARDVDSREIAARNCDVQLGVYALVLDALGGRWRVGQDLG